MGSLFRSEDMTLCQLHLQSEASYDAISQLGELGIVHFKDLTSEVNSYSKKFVSEIRRCDEMERQLRYFETEIRKEDGIRIQDTDSIPEAPAPRDMIDLEALFEKHESDLRELGSNINALKQNYSGLMELQQVLKLTDSFFLESSFSFLSAATDDPFSSSASADIDEQGAANDMELSHIRKVAADLGAKTYLGYVAGVIGRERLSGFMRLLWFACRGNVFIKHEDIVEPLEDPHTGAPVYKTVFMVFFQGEQLKARVKKICEGFKAVLYPCPESSDERQEMKLGVLTRIQDLDQVLTTSQEQRKRVLQMVSKNLRMWFMKVIKIKAIYHTLNMFNTEGRSEEHT